MVEFQHDEGISEKEPKAIEDLVEKVQAYLPGVDCSILEKAYTFSEAAHIGQLRRSGQPYIFHPLGVAAILADLKLDIPSIVTGLLHDTVEDTKVTLAEIETQFGKNISDLVDGVTKISKI